MTEVNRAALLEWVEELETTDKPQTKGWLNVPGRGFCCLGVMCELFAPRLNLVTQVESIPDSGVERAVRYRRADETGGSSLLPDSVANYIGTAFGWSVPVTYEGVERDVIYLNDALGLSFKEIAAVVRKEYDL